MDIIETGTVEVGDPDIRIKRIIVRVSSVRLTRCLQPVHVVLPVHSRPDSKVNLFLILNHFRADIHGCCVCLILCLCLDGQNRIMVRNLKGCTADEFHRSVVKFRIAVDVVRSVIESALRRHVGEFYIFPPSASLYLRLFPDEVILSVFYRPDGIVQLLQIRDGGSLKINVSAA